ASGGAVAPLRDHFLVANGVGQLFVVSRSAGKRELSAQHLNQSVPINFSDFEHIFGKQEDVTYFRTADLLVQDLGAKVRVFATHHFWKAGEQCFVMRVSMLEAETARLLQADAGTTAWKTIFEST